MKTYARLDHPRRVLVSDRRGCSLIKVLMPNSIDGHARYLSSSSQIPFKGKISNDPHLLRVTMMSIERNMPDELAPSINVELVKSIYETQTTNRWLHSARFWVERGVSLEPSCVGRPIGYFLQTLRLITSGYVDC